MGHRAAKGRARGHRRGAGSGSRRLGPEDSSSSTSSPHSVRVSTVKTSGRVLCEPTRSLGCTGTLLLRLVTKEPQACHPGNTGCVPPALRPKHARGLLFPHVVCGGNSLEPDFGESHEGLIPHQPADKRAAGRAPPGAPAPGSAKQGAAKARESPKHPREPTLQRQRGEAPDVTCTLRSWLTPIRATPGPGDRERLSHGCH